jgi:hypothetical protein
MAVPGRGGLTAALWAALLAGAASAGAYEPAVGRWDVSVAPYLWAARLDGDAKVAGVEADVDVGFEDTLEDLQIAGMAIIEARRDRFGFAVNPLFVRTKDDGGSGPLETEITTDIATAGASAWYQVAEWQIGRGEAGRPLTLAVEPLAGARLNHLRAELDATLDAAGGRARRQFDDDETWVDPLVGLQIVAQLSDRWAFRAEGDLGGFGVGSDFTWNAQAIVSYRVPWRGRELLFGVGYRALHWDYEDGDFAWDVTMSGPMLGAAVRF